MTKHKQNIAKSVEELEGEVESLYTLLRRKEADLKVMRLMLNQCEKMENSANVATSSMTL